MVRTDSNNEEKEANKQNPKTKQKTLNSNQPQLLKSPDFTMIHVLKKKDSLDQMEFSEFHESSFLPRIFWESVLFGLKDILLC